MAKLVGKQVQRQINHYQQTTPAASNQFKFEMEMEVLDGTSAASTELWELEGCFIQNVTYGDNDYAATDQQQIVLTIRYDNAIHAGQFMPEQTPGLIDTVLG